MRELQERQREVAEEEERQSALTSHKGKKEAYVKYLRSQATVHKKSTHPSQAPSVDDGISCALPQKAQTPETEIPEEPTISETVAVSKSCWEPQSDAQPSVQAPLVAVRDSSPDRSRLPGSQRSVEVTKSRGPEADSLEEARYTFLLGLSFEIVLLFVSLVCIVIRHFSCLCDQKNIADTSTATETRNLSFGRFSLRQKV